MYIHLAAIGQLIDNNRLYTWGRGCHVVRTALFASPTGAAALFVCLGSIVSGARGFGAVRIEGMEREGGEGVSDVVGPIWGQIKRYLLPTLSRVVRRISGWSPLGCINYQIIYKN